MESQTRILAVDPGENCGWCLASTDKLIGGGQTPLWTFAHDVWAAITENTGPLAEKQEGLLHAGVKAEDNVGPIKLMLIEKFALYPWESKNLAWNEFRTVQLIGALTFMATLNDIEVVKQPATIKERALAGGAEELFVRPLRDNRHQNDAAMHYFFYKQVTQGAGAANLKESKVETVEAR